MSSTPSMENALTDTAQYRLLVLGDGSVRTIPLLGTRWIVGRSQDCQVPLHDPTVSRKHLLLERLGEAFHFRDLGGFNSRWSGGLHRRRFRGIGYRNDFG